MAMVESRILQLCPQLLNPVVFQLRKHDQSRLARCGRERRDRVMTYASMSHAIVGEGHTKTRDRNPTERGYRVQNLALLHGGEPECGIGAHDSRSHCNRNRIHSACVLERNEPAVDVDGFEVAPERMPARARHIDQTGKLQLGYELAPCDWKGGAVGHQVANAG